MKSGVYLECCMEFQADDTGIDDAMGYGPMYLGASLRESVCKGRSREESQTCLPTLYSGVGVRC